MSKVSGKPDSLGQYLKIDLTRDILGVSSTGFVIRTCCSDEQGLSSRPCALKRIQTMDEEPPDLAKLLHENVVRLMHHWTEERDLFLVMELMDGDLAMLMAGTKRAGASPFSLSVAVDIMLQIAKGMLHLHLMDVSHPHLKCDNVLYKLTENKAEAFRVGDVLVKLGGFGCSRPADVNSKGWDILRFGLTCLAILTGDERSDDVSKAHMVPDMVVSRSSIPETTPVILKDCIVSCLDMQSTFSDVVMVLLRVKSYLMQTSNDEIMFSSVSIQTKIVQTKTEDYCEDESSSEDVEEIFAVHQLHPEAGDVSISLRATFIFFHGFHKVPEEWRRTWMTRDNKLVWPQKWLPEDLGAGNIRVLSVSFDADSNVSNNYSRHELGKNLVQKLVLSPSLKLGEIEDAIFLVGHSFGGVLIKSLVTEVRSFVKEQVHNNSDQEEVMKCEKFLSSLAKIVFYSVPHVAPGAVEFENYISECRKIVALQRSSFLQSLCEDSSFTADMNQLSSDFECAVSEEVEILVFLEGKPMSRGGGLVTIKACEEITKKLSSWEWHKIDMDNHFEVCRPDSKNHAGYKILLNNLQQHINALYGSTSTPSEVRRTSFKTIVWAVVAICKIKRRVTHSKPYPYNIDCQECDKIGSTDCIDRKECSSELKSVLGKRQIDKLLRPFSWRTFWEVSSSHGICFVQSPSVKSESNRSEITTISHSSGFDVRHKQTSSENAQDEKLSVKEFEKDCPFGEVLEEHIPAAGIPVQSRDQKPAENLKEDSYIGDKFKEIGRVRFREDLGKYVVEYRPPQFNWKLWMGTYGTIDEARRAWDCAHFYAGQNKGEFNFKDSSALFAELGPLNWPLTSVSKNVKNKAFNVELKKRAKQVIRAQRGKQSVDVTNRTVSKNAQMGTDHSSCNPRSTLYRTPLHDIFPQHIMESILKQLDNSDDRGAASLVCKKWQRLDGLTRKSVSISNCYSIAPSDLSRRFKNLEKIKINGKPRTFKFGLLVENWGGHAGPWIEEIARAYPKLQCLHLRRMDITDEDLKILAMKCTELQKLKLLQCSGFSTKGLELITQSCRHLRILDLEESDDMEDFGGPWLEFLQKGEGTLASLNIASAGLNEANVKESLHLLAPRLESMSSFRVRDMDLDSFFKILEYSVVPVIELGLGCYSTSQRVEPKELASSFSHRLSSVRVLDLKFTTMSAEIQIELLRHCFSLEELELQSSVGDRGMQVIGESCKKLKRIRVVHFNSTDYVTQKGMIAICEGCRELDVLDMHLADVDNEALAAVGRCLPKLTDFRIALLEVREVVENLPLDDGVRSLLQGCLLLTRFSVYLRAGSLSDKGVGYIGEFGAKLKSVLLGCSGESDEGLRLMADGCRELERLELRECPFGEAQIASSILNMWTHLKYLWVQGIGATANLGAALVSNKPDFLVEFMDETAQILGYYTLTQPRTDHPASVCLIYPRDVIEVEEELREVNSQKMHESTSHDMEEFDRGYLGLEPYYSKEFETQRKYVTSEGTQASCIDEDRGEGTTLFPLKWEFRGVPK